MELYGKMASSQDSRYGQKDSSDQNFDYMFKLLIIGNSSVGKTSFLFRYADDSFTSAFVSTVGIDFKVKTVFKNEKRIKLQIWAPEGSSRCIPLWFNPLPSSDGIQRIIKTLFWPNRIYQLCGKTEKQTCGKDHPGDQGVYSAKEQSDSGSAGIFEPSDTGSNCYP
nr:ras-related protein Rab-3C [Cavia porcellus]